MTIVSAEAVTSRKSEPAAPTSTRATALAERLMQGAEALATLASTLTAAEWETQVPHDGRTIGVVVHHVANMYPIEIQLARTVAGGQEVTGLTWDTVRDINADHAAKFSRVTKQEAIEALCVNSNAAAAAIRALSDGELDRSAPVSLYDGTTLTCQFLLEDHAVRHSAHHLARIKAAVRR